MYVFKKNQTNYNNILFSNNYVNFSKYINTNRVVYNYTYFCKFLNFINNNFFKIQFVSFSSNIYKNINNCISFKFNFFINTFVIKKKKLLFDILVYFKKINLIYILIDSKLNNYFIKTLTNTQSIFFNTNWLFSNFFFNNLLLNYLFKNKYTFLFS